MVQFLIQNCLTLCFTRCPYIGHAVKMWSAVCSGVQHLQLSEGARPYLYMNEWNCTAVLQCPSFLGQAYSNRPGTGHGYESMESECILTVFRVPSVIFQMRKMDA